jgi:predicted ATP-dependent endonuclease of OLD family
MSDQTLFEQTEPNEIDPEKDYTEELVGEGKKFSDFKGLARSKVEADRHINNLEKELAELREDLSARVQVADLVKELQTLRNTQTEGNPDPMSNPDNTNSAENDQITSDDIEKLVTSKLTEREAERQRNSNYESVKNTLTQAWGDSVAAKLKQAANDLGMTPAELDEFAKSRPKAFLRAVGADQPKREDSGSLFTQGDVSSAKFSGSNSSNKNYAYFNKIRKEDPARYHSRAVQAEMHREAARQREKFYE